MQPGSQAARQPGSLPGSQPASQPVSQPASDVGAWDARGGDFILFLSTQPRVGAYTAAWDKTALPRGSITGGLGLMGRKTALTRGSITGGLGLLGRGCPGWPLPGIL